MMMVKRFRSLGWVAMIAACAMAFYLVSLRVAAERAALNSVERAIVDARRDIRRLQTEIAARGSLRQLERWNGEVMALSAPEARQFLPGQFALASYAPDTARLPGVATPQVVMTAARPEPAEPPVPEFRRAVGGDAAEAELPVPASRSTAPQPGLHMASYQPGGGRLLDDSVMREISRTAVQEERRGR